MATVESLAAIIQFLEDAASASAAAVTARLEILEKDTSASSTGATALGKKGQRHVDGGHTTHWGKWVSCNCGGGQHHPRKRAENDKIHGCERGGL